MTGAFAIELRRIRPDPRQPRQSLSPEDQQELTSSIKNLGLLQPITVRYVEGADMYQIVTGERRYQAAKAAGLTEIPCVVHRPEARNVLLHQIVENWQRVDLQPFEIADALAVLRDAHGYSQKELSDLTGKPKSEISRLLSLLTLHPEVQKEARDPHTASITRRHLVALSQVPTAKQPEVFDRIKRGGFTALATEFLVKQAKEKAGPRKGPGAPKALRLHFTTSKATVTMTFQRKEASRADLFATIDEVRKQVQARPAPEDDGPSCDDQGLLAW